jgi:prepilin-type N-terminal cleavage/methylation domain-containing protein
MVSTLGRPRQRGFTLIELLIVIGIIALLALIVIPKLMGAVRRSKEASLRENLARVRTAVSQFYADTGINPGTLTDLIETSEGDLSIDVPAGTYKGPYLTAPGGIGGSALPINSFVKPSESDVARHWDYDPTTGDVVVTVDQQGDDWLTFTEGIYFRDL